MKKVLIALGSVLVVQGLLVLCLISALQIPAPRNMPFGVVGSSQLVNQVKKSTSLDTTRYRDKTAVIAAIDQSKLYGAYVAGSPRGTLIVVPAKSSVAKGELEQAFASAGVTLKTGFTVQTEKPLPASDPDGKVVEYLLLPVLLGGYLASVLVFKATSKAAEPWRATILAGYAILGAVLTDLIAGPLIGAYANSHFWPLLPAFALITATVAVAAAAIQGLVGRLGSLVVVLLFIILGFPSAGTSGQSMLPTYWQNIGAVLPPRATVNLIRNVLYFSGNSITTQVIILLVWMLAGIIVIGYLGRIRPALAAAGKRALQPSRSAAAATQPPGPATAWQAHSATASEPPGSATSGKVPRSRALSKAILGALAVVAVMECLFAFNYMDSGHAPVATNLPLGVTGSSPILTEVQKTLSLKVTRYPDVSAAKAAIGQAKIYGALVPGKPASTLIVVPSASTLAPSDLATHFERAARSERQRLKIQSYTPVPLPGKDPFGIVPSLMLLPLLVGGYVGSTMLLAATGKAADRWRAALLAGYAIGAGLVVDLIAGLWLQGYATDKFWIVWPIASLIIFTVSLIAAVLQKLLGAAGTLLTIIVVVLFGNPSSGGANGVPYLPTFWRDIGTYLPPRNAYILLHNAIYFDGHGTTAALVTLLLYAGIAGILLGVFEWYRTPPSPVAPDTEAEATVMVVPVAPP